MTRLTDRVLLRDGDVTVRLIRPKDAKPLQQLLQRNRAWLEPWEASLPGVRLAPPGSEPLGPLIRSLRRRSRQGQVMPFVVLYRNELVGQLTVADIAWGAVCSGQIGYWVAEEFAGRGIIPRAVRLTIEFALWSAGLHRVEICLRPENTASRRVVEKLGLRFEGKRLSYIFIDGAWRDHDCFAITSDETLRWSDDL